MSIYTRTGDRGETSLFGGKRVPKSAAVITAYGAIDELNSYLGLISALLTVVDVQDFLRTIQSDLFFLGAFLSGGDDSLKAILSRVKEMELRIDGMEEELPKLHTFILPGGSPLAAEVHIARSICRRAERHVVYLSLHPDNAVSLSPKPLEQTIAYLNRLSDFLFVLSRFCNHLEQRNEILWEEGRKK